jgi:hypothetical protein
MDRWSSLTLTALLLATLVVVVLGVRTPPSPRPRAAPSAPPVVVNPPPRAPTSASAESDGGPSADPAPVSAAARRLPPDAPATVRVGVIQFGYRGAELAAADAPPRDVARHRAEQALGPAREDFAKAVSLGDRASGADLGSIPRGVLEPDVEFAVFSLAPGEVHPTPLDTPRGYWVVRRIR